MLGGARVLLFSPVAKVALDHIEQVIGATSQGLGAAATASARKCGPGPKTNKVTKHLRTLDAAFALERHFTMLGTQRWMDSLVSAIDQLKGSADVDPISVRDPWAASLWVCRACLPRRLRGC
jgi:hypothetical protein